MNISDKHRIISLIAVFFVLHLKAQNNDCGLWMNLNFEKKLNDWSSVYANGLCRFQNNISELGTMGAEIGYGRKLGRNYSVSGFYRYFSRSRLDRSFSHRHRFFVDVMKQKKVLGLTVQGRMRFQYQVRDVYSSDAPLLNADYYLRPMIFLSKRLSYHVSFFSMGELFVPVQPGFKAPNTDRLMFYLGMNYRVNRHLELIPYYLINKALHTINPSTSFIFGSRMDVTF